MGFVEYFQEAESIVKKLTTEDDELALQKRLIHTLKGNSSVFGISSLFDICHEIEGRIEEEKEFMKKDKGLLDEKWRELTNTFNKFLGDSNAETIEVTGEELDVLLKQAKKGWSSKDIIHELHKWKHDPMRSRLKRVEQQALGIAKRLGQEELQIETNDNGLRIPHENWSGFWGAFIHVVRNGIDHGLKDYQPKDGSKPRLQISTDIFDDRFEIKVNDNGRGIDWSRVKEKANRMGLPSKSKDHLISALFADGLSTRDTATEMSGRGVGMSAIKSECESLMGAINIKSELDAGTTIVFSFPVSFIYASNIVAEAA